MTTLKAQWESYRDEVVVPSMKRLEIPMLMVPPEVIIERFRRAFYCGAASVFMSTVKKDVAVLQAGPMDIEKVFEELKAFSAEMSTK